MYSVPCEFIFRGVNSKDRERLCRQARGVQTDIDDLQTRIKRQLYARVKAVTADKAALEGRLVEVQRKAQQQRAATGIVAPQTAAELKTLKDQVSAREQSLAAANKELEAYRQVPQYLQGVNARIDAMAAALAALTAASPALPFPAASQSVPLAAPFPAAPRPSSMALPRTNVGVSNIASGSTGKYRLRPPTDRVDFLIQVWDILFNELYGKDISKAIMVDKSLLQNIRELAKQYRIEFPQGANEKLKQWLSKGELGRNNATPQEIFQWHDQLRAMLTPEEDARLVAHINTMTERAILASRSRAAPPFPPLASTASSSPSTGLEGIMDINLGGQPGGFTAPPKSNLVDLAIELTKGFSDLGMNPTEEDKRLEITNRGVLESVLKSYHAALYENPITRTALQTLLNHKPILVGHVGDFINTLLKTLPQEDQAKFSRETGWQSSTTSPGAPPAAPQEGPPESLQRLLDFQRAMNVIDEFKTSNDDAQTLDRVLPELTSNQLIKKAMVGLDDTLQRALNTGNVTTLLNILEDRLKSEKKRVFETDIPFVLEYTTGYGGVVEDVLSRGYRMSFPTYGPSGSFTDVAIEAFKSQRQRYDPADETYFTTTKESVPLSPPTSGYQTPIDNPMDVGGLKLG